MVIHSKAIKPTFSGTDQDGNKISWKLIFRKETGFIFYPIDINTRSGTTANDNYSLLKHQWF